MKYNLRFMFLSKFQSQFYSPKNYYLSSTEKEIKDKPHQSYHTTPTSHHTQDRCNEHYQPLLHYNPLCTPDKRQRSRTRIPSRIHSDRHSRDRGYFRSRTPARKYNRSPSRSSNIHRPYKRYRRSRSPRSRQDASSPDRRAILRSSISPFSSSCFYSSTDENIKQSKLKPRALFKVSPRGATAKNQSIKHGDASCHPKPENQSINHGDAGSHPKPISLHRSVDVFK